MVGVQNYSLHMNSETFPEPTSFKPDRWLAEDNSAQKEAFNGFGIGPRACIGRKYDCV